MQLRFVRLRVPEERLAELIDFYEQRVVPALQETEGCLFAGLLRQSLAGDECLSATFWESSEAIEAYEASGLFDELLDDMDPYLLEAQVWQTDLRSQGGASALPDPEVEAYQVDTPVLAASDNAGHTPVFVRMVSVRVDPENLPEFRRVFRREVIPALRSVHGCRDAFLVESVAGRSRIVSVTVWERDEDAVRYERSGDFERLTGRLAPLLADIEHWRLALASSRGTEEARHGLDVSGYQVVTAHQLGEARSSAPEATDT